MSLVCRRWHTYIVQLNDAIYLGPMDTLVQIEQHASSNRYSLFRFPWEFNALYMPLFHKPSLKKNSPSLSELQLVQLGIHTFKGPLDFLSLLSAAERVIHPHTLALGVVIDQAGKWQEHHERVRTRDHPTPDAHNRVG
ncbi:hypothetical protein SAMD00019534_096450 [Acytostelium subglobosum LB1]|uniref:hypothetical protein n=1 Tax=Acytostelium subglobosum LB1 TaxID=1410327 RepID=UPI00064484D9|nr:hypothetical protein SAMD00019534_096450 [Acytostelium subglobosum LB1]GAM26470.1 hypothetical protein SAMD00019534_096450 [Acytostelium subglobosum LB1]|eukprot:XP_012750566.1 hypothetical protein SAMD00019534_096450 [Acytostelium subglobosum LB1]